MADIKTFRDNRLSPYAGEEMFIVRSGDICGLLCRVRLEDVESGIILRSDGPHSPQPDIKDILPEFEDIIYAVYADDRNITKTRMENLISSCPPMRETENCRLYAVDDVVAAGALSGDFTHRKLFITDGWDIYMNAVNEGKSLLARGVFQTADEITMLLTEEREI